MKNNSKDRYENKLMRFLNELASITPVEYSIWVKKRNELFRKYGFTIKDWHRAIRLTESGQDSRHFWKHTNCHNDKTVKEWKYEDHCDFEIKDEEYED